MVLAAGLWTGAQYGGNYKEVGADGKGGCYVGLHPTDDREGNPPASNGNQPILIEDQRASLDTHVSLRAHEMGQITDSRHTTR